MNPQNNNQNISKTGAKLPSIYVKDSFLVYVFEKLKRVSEASFMVASTLRETSPLKGIIETLSLKIALPTEIKDIMTSRENPTLLRLADLLVLFETAQKLGEVSLMNAGVMCAEITKIMSEIELKREDVFLKGNIILNTDFFTVENPKKEEEVTKGHSYKGQYNVLYNPAKKDVQQKNETKILSKGQPVFENIKDKNSRRAEILGVLKGKGFLSIKDISETIKDCSEKTIQRELNSLLAEGAIKKTGDRRWSRYSLS